MTIHHFFYLFLNWIELTASKKGSSQKLNGDCDVSRDREKQQKASSKHFGKL